MKKEPNKQLNLERINRQLERLGLSQAQVSSELGVSREAVSKWLKNKTFPRPEKLLRLARFLRLSFDEIVTRIETTNEPVVAFRKKGSHKISADYIQNAKFTGALLEKLVPSLPFDSFSRPPSLINPRLDYQYIQRVAKGVRLEIGEGDESEIHFQNLITFFNKYHAVIIPVFWGTKHQHENALHIFLPKTMTTWIYLNLDSKIYDFKFWMAHELGHVKSPNLKEDMAEDFADAFAGALLVSKEMAEKEYVHLRRLATVPKQINRLKQVAEVLVVSPITIYYEINKYAKDAKKPKIDLERDREIYKATTNFGKEYPTVSQVLFDNKKPTPSEYISCPKKTFDSPFFEAVTAFLKENKKPAGFIQSVLNLPLADAQLLYEELC
jgi:transcriptional regulator with XRE-family HTH domain